jgi:hypothetical protein
VIDWIAYGHAVRTEKNTETFGQGDIRGVIAAEASTNAREGGALVPTIAFGVRASASMALLLSSFLMHGLVPGPEMLTKNITVTYAIIWSLVLAHAVGVTICVLASGQLARLANVRFGLLLPAVLSIAFIGAFEGAHSWGDIVSLIAFGVLGTIMKRLGWPRPPLILGFVLGAIFERYLFISISRYGAEWISRPVVVVMFAIAFLTMLRPLLRSFVETFGRLRGEAVLRPHLSPASAFTVAFILVAAAAVASTTNWPFQARIVPMVSASLALLFGCLNLVIELFGRTAQSFDPAQHYVGRPAQATAQRPVPEPSARFATGVHGAAAFSAMPRLLQNRTLLYFIWLLGLAALLGTFGFLPGIFLFILAFSRLEGGESWSTSLMLSSSLAAICWIIFDRLVALPWPAALVGDLYPALRAATGLM